MGQSLAQVYIHLVYGTKNRHPFINDSTRQRLHSYISATLSKYECKMISINSVDDHLHTLFQLSKNHSIAKVVEEIKKQSSKWIKGIENGHRGFSWQIGYGAFSVSSSKIQSVKNYIGNQKEHHKKITFKEEIEEFFKQYDVIDYDEKYFWS